MPDASDSTNFKSILQEQQKFYANLYKHQDREKSGDLIFWYVNSIEPDRISKVKNQDEIAL